MTVQSSPSTKGQKALKHSWPVTEGLTFGTTKQSQDRILRPEASFAQGEIHGR